MKLEPMPSGAKHLVLAHGNSFPGGSYRLLIEAWERAGWTVHAIDRFGHDARFPVTSNWPHLRDELIEAIERQAQLAEGKVMLVGHSLGGLLSLMAASHRPDLVQGLVMLDSPVVGGWRAQGLRMVKALRLIERFTPARQSMQRRQEWADRAAVHKHFAAKRQFARWDPRALAAYVEAGFEEVEGKTLLRFRREVESRIYNTLPHHFDEMLRRFPVQCRCAFVAGTRSIEMRQGGTASARTLAKQHFVWIEGSHLYPFERPDETAALVLNLMEVLRHEAIAQEASI